MPRLDRKVIIVAGALIAGLVLLAVFLLPIAAVYFSPD